MSASTLIILPQVIVLARSLRDAIAKTNPSILAGYKAAHVLADARTHHEFLIDGILGEALAADPNSTTSFLNLACDTCERIASFKADGARLFQTDRTPNLMRCSWRVARSSSRWFVTDPSMKRYRTQQHSRTILCSTL